ncbi:MAG: NAD(P)/FAD-dependent oxidoreductase [Cytophagales bacterium]|nr:MAG: NAD(P)/FAD-dependent oxidoreductase [Cytophagales bacterium]
MKDKIYDCAIIGGGLAGLSLAILLSRKGYKVILFEKKKYPFHRVCGEYISKESLGFLNHLGLATNQIDYADINEVLISAPNGHHLLRPLSLGGIGISRYFLDNELYKIAEKNGAEIIQETSVEEVNLIQHKYHIKTINNTYVAKLAIACQGKNSNLNKNLKRKSLGPKENYVGIKYHIKTDFSDNRIELHNFAGGYAGISKVENKTYCLCYLTKSKNLKRFNGNIKKMEEEILYQNPYLKNYFTNSEFLFKEPITVSQITFSIKAPIVNQMLVLGDSAGTIAPLCGNGMSLALHASALAEKNIEAYLKEEIDLKKLQEIHQQTWVNQFAFRIRFGALIQKLFGKTMLTNISIQILKQFPSVVDYIIKKTHGKPF